jgi:alpha-ketoglutarate-dependent taurine dioxygenase
MILGSRLLEAVREHGYGVAQTNGLTNRQLYALGRCFGERWDRSYPILDIRYESPAGAGAFTRNAVPPHCECAYDAQPPRYMLFYSEAPSDAGGAFYLVPMNEVLERLPKTDRRALRTTAYTMISPRTGLAASRPLVTQVEGVGDVLVYASDPARGNVELFSYPGGAAETLFDRVGAIIADPRLHIRHRWRRGDVVVFDNARFLHGREKYRGRRHLKQLRIGSFTV